MADSTSRGNTTKDKTTDDDEVTEYRSMSLKKEFIAKGPIVLTEDQNFMQLHSFAKVQALISKHVWMKFNIT